MGVQHTLEVDIAFEVDNQVEVFENIVVVVDKLAFQVVGQVREQVQVPKLQQSGLHYQL